MDWQTIATLATMLFGIVGGIWLIENRFERKLKEVRDEIKETQDGIKVDIKEVETRLQAGIAENRQLITENRQLIIEYIAKK